MRDIRNDLAERITHLNDQIGAADRELKLKLNRLKQEHEGKISYLKADFDAVKTVLELEQRRLQDGQPVARSNGAPAQMTERDQTQERARFLDILIRKLSDDGPASSSDLREWAIQGGYLDDSKTSGAALYSVLIETAKAGLIRQLPDGKFAAPSITELIRLQHTV
jgi:hypothetical protein